MNEWKFGCHFVTFSIEWDPQGRSESCGFNLVYTLDSKLVFGGKAFFDMIVILTVEVTSWELVRPKGDLMATKSKGEALEPSRRGFCFSNKTRPGMNKP